MYFLSHHFHISWGASTILLGGPLGILGWQARARTYPHNVWGGRRGGLHLKMSDFGLHGGGEAPQAPPYWETLLGGHLNSLQGIP